MKHKHYDLILAWANGAEIQYYFYDKWSPVKNPNWDNETEYRIKPEPKPDIVLYSYSTKLNFDFASLTNARSLDHLRKNIETKPNIKLTYDGDTNELKSVEKI